MPIFELDEIVRKLERSYSGVNLTQLQRSVVGELLANVKEAHAAERGAALPAWREKHGKRVTHLLDALNGKGPYDPEFSGKALQTAVYSVLLGQEPPPEPEPVRPAQPPAPPVPPPAPPVEVSQLVLL